MASSSAASSLSALEKRYVSGHVFHDEATGFTLSLAGVDAIADLDRALHKYAPAVSVALAKISDIESGKIVNATVVKSESENRSVDHYNHRMEEEKVPGKSLGHSLRLWQEIQTAINAIRNGSVMAPNGRPYTAAIFNGIGGSFLGPLMLTVAMLGADYNTSPELASHQRLFFISNTDPDSFTQILCRVELETTLCVHISKSGSTAETKGNMESFNALLRAKLAATGGDVDKKLGAHNIAITTRGSKFDQFAKTNQFLHIFYMENETGGRTSVMSAVGMVPAAFAGLDFAAFLKGQCEMDKMTRRADTASNPAALLAVAIDAITKQQTGRKNMIVLGYSDSLREFAHYLQQLYMESLGKEYDEMGRPMPEGQTVFGGVGTGEQHAFMQQVQKGIHDAFVRFVHFLRRSNDYSLAGPGSMGRQLLAFVKGTEAALASNGKFYITSTFERCDMFNLGMMVALEERIVTMLAAFRGLNAYDQPGVQDGKLAADAMNSVSLAVEDKILKLVTSGSFSGSWTGDAEKAMSDLQLVAKTPLVFVDAVLSDMYANIELPQSYEKLFGKIRVQRKFAEHRFVYTICKL